MKTKKKDFRILSGRWSSYHRGFNFRLTVRLLTWTLLVLVICVIGFFTLRSCVFNRVSESGSYFQPLWSDTLTNQLSDIEALKPMDRDIERFMARNGIKGLSLAISDNDSLLFAKGYGWADEEGGVEMTPTSMMRIASASKLITAIAIMKLVDDGKIKLDDKVLGPDGILNDTIFTNVLGDARMTDITVDQLLMHRGGFTNRGGDPMFSVQDIIQRNNLDHAPNSEEMARLVLKRRLGYAPGTSRRYSNFSYLLLSMVIEKVTGKEYYEFVTEEILKPAKAANFRYGTNYYDDRHEGETRYYGTDTVLVEEFNGSGRMVERIYGGNDIYGLKGAGGWIAAAPDLLRVVCSADGISGVNNLISERSIEVMTSVDPEDPKENYSRGWAFVDEDGSWVRTGTLNSTHAYIHRFPDGQCWVILTNSGNWRGANFSNTIMRLVRELHRNYTDSLPRRNLW